MRDFTDRSRFTVRSLPEIFEGVSVSVAKLKARRDGIGGRMSREVVLNSLFCYFYSLTPEEQVRVFDSGMERLLPLLDHPDSDAEPVPGVVPVDVQVSEAPAPPAPKSKRQRRA